MPPSRITRQTVRGHSLLVVSRARQPRVRDNLGQRCGGRTHHRASERHGLQGGPPKTLVAAGKGEASPASRYRSHSFSSSGLISQSTSRAMPRSPAQAPHEGARFRPTIFRRHGWDWARAAKYAQHAFAILVSSAVPHMKDNWPRSTKLWPPVDIAAFGRGRFHRGGQREPDIAILRARVSQSPGACFRCPRLRICASFSAISHSGQSANVLSRASRRTAICRNTATGNQVVEP